MQYDCRCPTQSRKSYNFIRVVHYEFTKYNFEPFILVKLEQLTLNVYLSIIRNAFQKISYRNYLFNLQRIKFMSNLFLINFLYFNCSNILPHQRTVLLSIITMHNATFYNFIKNKSRTFYKKQFNVKKS